MIPGYTELIARTAASESDAEQFVSELQYNGLQAPIGYNPRRSPYAQFALFNRGQAGMTALFDAESRQRPAGTVSYDVLTGVDDEVIDNHPQFGEPFAAVDYSMPSEKEMEAIQRGRLVQSLPDLVPVDLYARSPYQHRFQGETAPNVDFGGYALNQGQTSGIDETPWQRSNRLGRMARNAQVIDPLGRVPYLQESAVFRTGKPFDNKMPLPGRRGEPPQPSQGAYLPGEPRYTGRPWDSTPNTNARFVAAPGIPVQDRLRSAAEITPAPLTNAGERGYQLHAGDPVSRVYASAYDRQGRPVPFVDRSAPGAMQVALTRDQIIQLTETGNPAWREKYLSAHRPVQQDRRLANAARGVMNSLNAGASETWDNSAALYELDAGQLARPDQPGFDREDLILPTPGDSGYADSGGWEELDGQRFKTAGMGGAVVRADLPVRNGGPAHAAGQSQLHAVPDRAGLSGQHRQPGSG